MNAPLPIDETTEWLEADGLGGFASGTTSGIRTRRYHALLPTAQTPPTGRVVLSKWSRCLGGRNSGSAEFLTRQRYSPGVIAPQHGAEIASFRNDPWPTWVYRLRSGARIQQEILVPRGMPVVALRWRLLSGAGEQALSVRPFFSGRDLHALHHENPIFRFDANGTGRAAELDAVRGRARHLGN